jgi:hypothetical protein
VRTPSSSQTSFQVAVSPGAAIGFLGGRICYAV